MTRRDRSHSRTASTLTRAGDRETEATMILGRSVAGIVVSVLLVLRAMAFASPPDPSWVAGFWDDGDYDDVVILITATAGVAESSPGLDVRPIGAIVAVLVDLELALFPIPAPSSYHLRAPPTA